MMPGSNNGRWIPLPTARVVFMAHPQVKGRRVYGQVGFNFAAHARGIAFNAGEWPLLTLTVPREELIFEKGNVTVYADSADGGRRLCEWVKEASTTTQNAPLAVDTAPQWRGV